MGNKMADKNVLAPAPTRSDEQILPFAAWVPIGKSNYVLDLQKSKRIQSFSSLWIFCPTQTSSGLLLLLLLFLPYTFNSFGIRLLMWKKLELTDFRKTFGHDRPKYPVLQKLWGIITCTKVDFAKLMWEEFVQAIQTFLTDKANMGSPTKKGRKDKPHVIPYCRFTKLIICHLGRIHNIHQRSASPFHLADKYLRLGNLKFVSKGEADEVFGMPIPNEMISNNIQNAPYYSAYLEMVAKHDQKVAAKKEGKKKTTSSKQPKPNRAIEKLSKLAPAPKLKLVDEPDEEPAHSEPETEPEHQGEGEDFDMARAIHMSLELFQRQTPATEEASTGPSAQPLDDTSGNIVRDSLSPTDAEKGARSDKTSSGGDTEVLKFTEELGEDMEKQENVEEKTESLKFLADEHAILEDPLRSTGTLSSMKNLEDAYAIGDQFINDKSTDDEPGKLNVEAEVVSMVTIPIYQASSSVPLLSTPVIDLSPPKPASSTTQTPIFTATTTTTTAPLPPPS
ncbi:hypothetical protein Tco_1430027 [Tanacetum coccineum]